MDEETRKRLFADRECYGAMTTLGEEVQRLAHTLEGSTWSGSVPNNPMTSQIEKNDFILGCTGMDRRLIVQIYKKAGDPSKTLNVAPLKMIDESEYSADAHSVGDSFEIRWNPGHLASTELADYLFQKFVAVSK